MLTPIEYLGVHQLKKSRVVGESPNLRSPTLRNSQFAKYNACQIFPPYGSSVMNHHHSPSFTFLLSIFPFSSLHPSSPFLLSHPLSSPPTLLPSSPFFSSIPCSYFIAFSLSSFQFLPASHKLCVQLAGPKVTLRFPHLLV